MWSLLGSTLANAFLCHFEKQWFSDCPQDFSPDIYRRYFDGIFVTLSSHDTKHPIKKFTFEHDHNDTIPGCQNMS